MTRNRALLLTIAFIISGALGLALWTDHSDAATSDNWPQWRGPNSNGADEDADLPLTWSETENILWKVEIPGQGSASPIVWGDRIFVQTAISAPVPAPAAPEAGGRQGRRGRRRGPPGKSPSLTQFKILALQLSDGRPIWEKTLLEKTPHEGTHPTGTWASNSPVTDGEYIYSYFGSNGIYCLDLDGNLKWKKDLGDMRKRLGFGEGSSPALYKDTLVILWDHEDDSFIVALDKKDGSEKWRTARDEITSWASPLIVEYEGKAQIVTGATNRVRSYDLETGKLLWEDSGLTLNPIPSPVHSDGIVYVTAGFRGSALRAIDLAKAQGEITGTDAVLWSYDQDTPYVPTPVLYQKALYILKVNSPILTAINVNSGEPYYARQRLESLNTIYSSPIAAKDRLYIFDREGNAVVIKHGKEFEVLASNQLDDGFDASPAIIGDTFLLRGHKNLYRIGKP